jgi:hypothetical protein
MFSGFIPEVRGGGGGGGGDTDTGDDVEEKHLDQVDDVDHLGGSQTVLDPVARGHADAVEEGAVEEGFGVDGRRVRVLQSHGGFSVLGEGLVWFGSGRGGAGLPVTG